MQLFYLGYIHLSQFMIGSMMGAVVQVVDVVRLLLLLLLLVASSWFRLPNILRVDFHHGVWHLYPYIPCILTLLAFTLLASIDVSRIVDVWDVQHGLHLRRLRRRHPRRSPLSRRRCRIALVAGSHILAHFVLRRLDLPLVWALVARCKL